MGPKHHTVDRDKCQSPIANRRLGTSIAAANVAGPFDPTHVYSACCKAATGTLHEGLGG